jgi:hypothetical protein
LLTVLIDKIVPDKEAHVRGHDGKGKDDTTEDQGCMQSLEKYDINNIYYVSP